MNRTVAIPKSIGIIGGGIGGVATAVALRRAGIDATIYERAPRMREVGSGMMLWPNATRVLRELGLLESVLTHSGSSTNFLVRARSGKVLMDIALGQFDVPVLCVRRADLLSVLLSALGPDQVRLGQQFHHLEQSTNKVQLHFADGSVREHDAVIGADGIRSRVREMLFGPSEPVYRGYVVWRGMAQYDGNAIGPGENSETWGTGQCFGILDIGQSKFTWYATLNVAANHSDAPGGRKGEIQKAFAGWHDPIAELIDASDDNDILKHGAYDHFPLQCWSKGRVTLLGDAAHPCTPNLGQGGCMALEDAMVLAKCADQNASIEAALCRYESLRRPRTRHVQKRSLLMGHIGQWENGLVVGGRRVVTKLLPARLFEHNLRRMYSYESAAS
jgi:2-polyprenyl-6-methoxyphenol hydroxylase-like FAD-dependent oxidoreductase